MRFKDQVEQMLQCKVNGMCARDGLVTEYLKNRVEHWDEVFEAKQADDTLFIELLKVLVQESKDE